MHANNNRKNKTGICVKHVAQQSTTVQVLQQPTLQSWGHQVGGRSPYLLLHYQHHQLLDFVADYWRCLLLGHDELLAAGGSAIEAPG